MERSINVPLPPSRIWNPAAYQGHRNPRRYFEGWYYKHVSADRSRILALIPGISHAADPAESHAFVQFVPSWMPARYFTFPLEEFSFDRSHPFEVRVGPNSFSSAGISLNLADADLQVSGNLSFGEWAPWPVRPLSPGIMGPFRFAPRMQTYHGVLSLDHTVTGEVTIVGGGSSVSESRTDFSGGHGYVEKDWGRSFPSSWIWAQSNTFSTTGTSAMLSVARIPWMGSSFVGSIAGLYLRGELYRFATYTGARIRRVETADNYAIITIADNRHEIEFELHGAEAMSLPSPVHGAMEGRAAESLGGSLDVTLRRRRTGEVLFRETGLCAGIEVMNSRGELTR